MPDSDNSSEEENLDLLREAADTQFMKDSMFQSNRDRGQEEVCEEERLPSLRPQLDKDQQYNELNVTPEFQKFVAKRLGAVIDKKMDFIENSTSSRKQIENTAKRSGLLLADSQSHVRTHSKPSLNRKGNVIQEKTVVSINEGISMAAASPGRVQAKEPVNKYEEKPHFLKRKKMEREMIKLQKMNNSLGVRDCKKETREGVLVAGGRQEETTNKLDQNGSVIVSHLRNPSGEQARDEGKSVRDGSRSEGTAGSLDKFSSKATSPITFSSGQEAKKRRKSLTEVLMVDGKREVAEGTVGSLDKFSSKATSPITFSLGQEAKNRRKLLTEVLMVDGKREVAEGTVGSLDKFSSVAISPPRIPLGEQATDREILSRELLDVSGIKEDAKETIDNLDKCNLVINTSSVEAPKDGEKSLREPVIFDENNEVAEERIDTLEKCSSKAKSSIISSDENVKDGEKSLREPVIFDQNSEVAEERIDTIEKCSSKAKSSTTFSDENAKDGEKSLREPVIFDQNSEVAEERIDKLEKCSSKAKSSTISSDENVKDGEKSLREPVIFDQNSEVAEERIDTIQKCSSKAKSSTTSSDENAKDGEKSLREPVIFDQNSEVAEERIDKLEKCSSKAKSSTTSSDENAKDGEKSLREPVIFDQNSEVAEERIDTLEKCSPKAKSSTSSDENAKDCEKEAIMFDGSKEVTEEANDNLSSPVARISSVEEPEDCKRSLSEVLKADGNTEDTKQTIGCLDQCTSVLDSPNRIPSGSPVKTCKKTIWEELLGDLNVNAVLSQLGTESEIDESFIKGKKLERRTRKSQEMIAAGDCKKPRKEVVDGKVSEETIIENLDKRRPMVVSPARMSSSEAAKDCKKSPGHRDDAEKIINKLIIDKCSSLDIMTSSVEAVKK